MVSTNMEEKETQVGRKKVATYTGSTPQSVKKAQAEIRQRSISVGPPVPEAGSKPLLPDKGNKPKKKAGFLRPPSSETTMPTQESATSPLFSVEEEGEREPSQNSAVLTKESMQSTDNDNTADLASSKENAAKAKVLADSDQINMNSRDEKVDLEEDDEKSAAATKEISCDVSEKPLALAFTAPVAIEFKKLEAIQFEESANEEDKNPDERQQPDENMNEKKISESNSKSEEAEEKWKDAVDIAVKSKSEEKEPSKKESNHAKDEQMESSDTQEQQEEENNNNILSKSESEKKVVKKAPIEESNNKDSDEKAKVKEENKGSEMSERVNSTTTEKEELSSPALTIKEKPIEAEQLEASVISEKSGEVESIPVIKASDENKIEVKLVEGSNLVEKGENDEKCAVVEGGEKKK